MKRITTFLIFILVNINLLFSNPIAPPQAIISELNFKESDNWILEIFCHQGYLKSEYDSICIETAIGFSKIRLDNIPDSISMFVITSDSLSIPLTMDSKGDSIILHSFLSSSRWNIHLTHSLIFGKYSGSTIDSLPEGYSIAYFGPGMFYRDRNPSVGILNDSIGTCGIIRGHLYDKNNNLITDELYHSDNSFFLDNYFSLEDDDTYSTNIYSRNNTFEYISIIDQSGSGGFKNVHITPIELDIYPGCLYERDIHILDDITGVDENNSKPDNNIIIMNYPNPFNSSTNFAVTIPSSQKYKHKQINIYNTLGQKINSIPLKNQSSVQWDGKDFGGKDAATGTYFYQLILDNQVFKSGSMILLK